MAIMALTDNRAQRTFLLFLSVSALFAAGTLLAAEKQGPNTSEKPHALTGTALATKRSHLASELAAYGRESQNAMALIVAAEMQAQAGGQEVHRDKRTEGPNGAGDDEEPREDMYTVAAMLSDARDLARGDDDLLAAIEQVTSRESKGRPRQPATLRDRVLAGQTDNYKIRFRGGEPAIVSVTGDGGTDLDLRIYDEGGNLICSQPDNSDRCYCRWQPLWTGTFRIQITNHGSVSNNYTLRTNY